MKTCYEKRDTSTTCLQAEEDLARCTNQAMCPAEFASAMSCLGDDPEARVAACMPAIQALKACAESVGDRVYSAVSAEVVRQTGGK